IKQVLKIHWERQTACGMITSEISEATTAEMYWDVGHEHSHEDIMAQETEMVPETMGSKQSELKSLSLGQCPALENIEAAYRAGELERAQQLTRLCLETNCKVEKLLGITASHGDSEMVEYLLQEARVELSKELSDSNPVIIAAHEGHEEVVKILLNSTPGLCDDKNLLNWMLAAACKQGHLDVVRLLVRVYKAETDSCGMKVQDHPIITGQPLYAAMKTGSEEIAGFLLENGACFSSYVLLDHPELSNRLLRKQFTEPSSQYEGSDKQTVIDISDNKLELLPTTFLHCFKSLSSLRVSRNILKYFPEPWACPLKCCNVSGNFLESLPSTLCVFWKNYLKEANFSDNSLKEVPANIFELKVLNSMKLSGNQLQSLPSVDRWQCTNLKSLDLSRNHFGKSEEGARTRKVSFFTTRQKKNCDTVSPVEFPQFLGECLEVLHLDNNFLDSVPQSVCWLRALSELYLSNNPGIRELPAELGQLANLWQLDIEQLNISNVPTEVRNEGPSAVLAYLRAQLRKAVPCKLLKMIIVGPPRQGKSTLLETLQSGKATHNISKEGSIQTTSWELLRPASLKTKVDSVVFNVWDVGSAARMSSVNQCFFTDKALYVVVWNLALGEEAVANLQPWLLNIEAKAPNATVIVVGTHLDLIDTKFRTERIATLRAYVLALCRSPSGPRATGYPDISCRNLHEISCKTLDGLDGLRKLIFQVACSMKETGILTASQKLVGRMIPKSYFNLLNSVLKEQQRRSNSNEVQYLTDQQLGEIVQQTPDNDIQDFEDLQTAFSFLIETGALLHFPDTSHGLCNLYFLHPVWLSECLERIINLKASRSLVKNGIIQVTELRSLLVGTGFTEQTEEQYFQFLAKFEIALPITNNSYLLPHLLPPKPGLEIVNLRGRGTNTIQRLFKMNFVPVGFWERFIARILISLAEMDAQLFENESNPKRGTANRTSIYSFTRSHRRNRCSTFRVRRNQTIYWQEGLQVNYDGGFLSVESSEVNWKRKKSAGIKINCQSETRDFSAVAFITDHVNSLIDQWFPALTATEADGTPLVEQYVPCPHCTPAATGETLIHSQAQGRHYFSMEDCLLTAIKHTHIECPNHPTEPVSLQELVPELFMTDFP
ncbi:hypothetical protein scyTo_0014663, partial [Scyliorhinus torazame]|nr:hypothetical protein [Scyliorhinus torazame]